MASTRGKNYSECELKQLCYSVLHVSQDPAVGTGQRAEKFWDRVAEHYHRNKGREFETRGKKSLEGKWADIKHDVQKFIGAYQQVDNRQVSGTNSEDTLKLAKDLYRENHPKNRSFAFECCYYILKDCPRFINPHNNMARGKSKKVQRNVADKDYRSAEVVEVDDDDAPTDVVEDTESNQGSNKKRPSGNRAAKDEAKRLRSQEEALKISAQAQREMAAANTMRSVAYQNNSMLAMLSFPIENMSPGMKKLWEDWKYSESLKPMQRVAQQNSTKIGTISSTAAPDSGFGSTPAVEVPPPMVVPRTPAPVVEEEVEDDLEALFLVQERQNESRALIPEL